VPSVASQQPSHTSSEVLRASAILLIRVGRVQAGPWGPSPAGLAQRSVTMTVSLLDVLKGAPDHPPLPADYEFTVIQIGTGGYRVTDYEGVWSHADLSEGKMFVAFSSGDSTSVTVLLTEPYLEQLEPADLSLPDVRTALDLERRGASPTAILDEAEQKASSLHDIFARYVWAKVGAQAMSSLETFDRLVGLVERGDTTESARSAYLRSMREELGMMDSPPREWQTRLVKGMLNFVAFGPETGLRDRTKSVYLPNDLALREVSPSHTPSEVFAADPRQREAVRERLEAEPPQEGTGELIQWLRSDDG